MYIGTSNDYRALKEHKFFNGIDFEELNSMKPPVIKAKSPYKSKKTKTENLADDVGFSKAAAMVQSKLSTQSRSPKKRTSRNGDSNNSSCFQSVVETSEKPCRMAKPHSLPPKREPSIVLKGNIAKRSPFFIFYQTRLLVLTEEPSLKYYNPSTKELRVFVVQLFVLT